MRAKYQARWISKKRIDALKKSGSLRRGMLMDSFKGFIVIEPAGSSLGDGELLTPDVVDYELDPAWCLDSRQRISAARKLLGLEASFQPEASRPARTLVSSGNVAIASPQDKEE